MPCEHCVQFMLLLQYINAGIKCHFFQTIGFEMLLECLMNECMEFQVYISINNACVCQTNDQPHVL